MGKLLAALAAAVPRGGRVLEIGTGALFAAQVVSYAVSVPLGPAGYSYSDTNYILAQMIITAS